MKFFKKKNKYEIAQSKYADHAFDQEFDWNWKEINFNRMAIVNALLNSINKKNPSYLEIGCASNWLFDSVPCIDKTGVDPQAGGTIRTTSDEFFATNTKKFDVIFIDGLHHYDQVHRDANNALKFLNPGGWIAFHDFLPRNWKEHHVPIVQGIWTGDCWKTAFEIIESKDIEFKIALADYGVGVMRPKKKNTVVVDQSALLADKQFKYYYENFSKLPVTKAEDVLSWIENS